MILALLGGSFACSGDTTGPAPRNPAQAYWTLELNQHAVNLTVAPPYDTVQLTATALTADGMPVPGVDSVVHYRGIDSTVTISATGLVTAHYVTGQTQVIASLTTQGLTLTDTVFLQVTQNSLASPLSTFSMQPLPNDSAKRSVDYLRVNQPFLWAVTATNIKGDTICHLSTCPLQVYYHSSDSLVAQIDRSAGILTAKDTGHVILTATTTAYGVVRRDSVVFTVGYALKNIVSITLDTVLGKARVSWGVPPKMIMGINAVVDFNNQLATPVNVQFDDTTSVDTASARDFFGNLHAPKGSGNISPFGGFGYPDLSAIFTSDSDWVARRFLLPGVYRYYATLIPSDTFTIIVQAQR